MESTSQQWYLYRDGDGRLLVAHPLAPATRRAEEDCYGGPWTAQQVRQMQRELGLPLVWR